MTFDAHDRSLDLLRALVPLLAQLAVLDGELASQCRRAAQSVALNVAEASRRTLRDRRNRFRIALGSTSEVSSCLPCLGASPITNIALVSPW
jgi:four helix bundle protein